MREIKFQYSVIGDNTKENREHLEMLGYELENKHEGGEYLVTHLRMYNSNPLYWCAVPLKQDNHIGSINCLGNHPLFKAVSAISTTTDIGKHYINNHTGQWRQCDYNMATDENMDWGDWTEATLTELINHFK